MTGPVTLRGGRVDSGVIFAAFPPRDQHLLPRNPGEVADYADNNAQLCSQYVLPGARRDRPEGSRRRLFYMCYGRPEPTAMTVKCAIYGCFSELGRPNRAAVQTNRVNFAYMTTPPPKRVLGSMFIEPHVYTETRHGAVNCWGTLPRTSHCVRRGVCNSTDSDNYGTDLIGSALFVRRKTKQRTNAQ